MESPNSKRHKSSEDQDMISNLPDFISGRILSLLPTKDAVRTSVLSKSWTYKWTFITNLHFEDHTGPYYCTKIRKDLFVSFVNRVLLRLNSSSIQSFSLAISDEYEPLHVDQWISAVVSRKLKKLCVNSKFQLQTLSSHSLMKYKSLEELVLNVLQCEIDVPTFALFSSLTVLNLSGVQFSVITSNKSGNVHLNFPVLRTYTTSNCTWSSNVKCVTLQAPLLQMVSIHDYSYPTNIPYPTIKCCAPRLTELSYDGYPFPDLIMFDLSAAYNIASADICIGFYKKESLQKIMALSIKILKQFPNVKRLRFQKWLSPVLLAKGSLTDLPSFEKLSFLQLGGDVTCEILMALLLKTPYLKTLIFQDLLQSDQELLNYDPVPGCFLNTLQVVEFRWFDGSEHQLNFAKFAMENAVALKRMTLFSNWKLHGSKLEEVKEMLSSFKKKCSSFMSLEFSSAP
ncbi:F-box/FBD/LRR-repeat protein At3g14710-like [Lotus japonicus]|uniref:F-box/FBD/LRR-repeat protein At3g14710-like n=1 Tax=Lotus japonicus TaxID=34305 RepID=UPI0025870FD6|nr:F-box/FBD/LRR-repeat protein At3g14710-like [Lotus japonicus]